MQQVNWSDESWTKKMLKMNRQKGRYESTPSFATLPKKDSKNMANFKAIHCHVSSGTYLNPLPKPLFSEHWCIVLEIFEKV